MLIASHISAEMTSRTVRAPSRARPTQETTLRGVVRVERQRAQDARRGRSVARLLRAHDRAARCATSAAGRDRRGGPGGRREDAVEHPRRASARATLRPSQNSSCAMRASIAATAAAARWPVQPPSRSSGRRGTAWWVCVDGAAPSSAAVAPPRAPTCPWTRRPRGVDDHRALDHRDAREAARHDPDVARRRRRTAAGRRGAARARRRRRRSAPSRGRPSPARSTDRGARRITSASPSSSSGGVAGR